MASASARVISRSSRAAFTLARAASRASADRSNPWMGNGARRSSARASARSRSSVDLASRAERGPALDAEVPVHVGRAVHGEEARLDQEGARAAHRVDQRLVAGVADGAEDGGGERLLERGHRGPHAVARAGSAARRRRRARATAGSRPGGPRRARRAGGCPRRGGPLACSRSRSTRASLIFSATKPEWVCSESRSVASTANVACGIEVLLPGDFVRRVIESLAPRAPRPPRGARAGAWRCATRGRCGAPRGGWPGSGRPPRSARTRAAPSSVSSSARRSSVPRAAVAKRGRRLGIEQASATVSTRSLQAWLTAGRRSTEEGPDAPSTGDAVGVRRSARGPGCRWRGQGGDRGRAQEVRRGRGQGRRGRARQAVRRGRGDPPARGARC